MCLRRTATSAAWQLLTPIPIRSVSRVNLHIATPPREIDLSMVVLRSGKSTIIEELSDEMIVQGARDMEHLRLIRELGLKSIIMAPMVINRRSLGMISFVTGKSGRRYTKADLQTAEELARRARPLWRMPVYTRITTRAKPNCRTRTWTSARQRRS